MVTFRIRRWTLTAASKRNRELFCPVESRTFSCPRLFVVFGHIGQTVHVGISVARWRHHGHHPGCVGSVQMRLDRHSPDPDAQLKVDLLEWIGANLGEKLSGPFEKVLKDGVILCKLINKLKAGSVKKIHAKGGNFVLMQNIEAFQNGMKAYGVPHDEIFQTVDLFEARNIHQVVMSLGALARIASNSPGYAGPTLGPKMAEENKREFSEESQRAQRDGQVGLQYGSNKGATQAGVSMGGQRHM